MDARPGGQSLEAKKRSLRVASLADRVASCFAQSSQAGIQDIGRPAGAAGGDEIPAHGNEPAVPAGAGALPRTAQNLRQYAPAKGARISRTASAVPGAEENHSAQERARDLREPARSREEHAGPPPPFA